MDGVTHDKIRQDRPVVEIDYERYQVYLDDPELSDDQKRQIIDSLWSIIVAFVALGFGVHPAQSVFETSGKTCKVPLGSAHEASDALYFEQVSEHVDHEAACECVSPVEKEDSDDRSEQ